VVQKAKSKKQKSKKDWTKNKVETERKTIKLRMRREQKPEMIGFQGTKK